jgi:hypothetical protein
MHELIILAVLCTPRFEHGMTIGYLSSPHQHKLDVEILDESVLIRAVCSKAFSCTELTGIRAR